MRSVQLLPIHSAFSFPNISIRLRGHPKSEESEDDMKTHLVDIHNGENCLIQESCFAEKEKIEVSLAILSFQITL